MLKDFDIFLSGIWTPIIFLISLILVIKICEIFNYSYKNSLFLYFWHTLFCLIYLWFTLNNIADSRAYYSSAISNENLTFNFGTSFIKITTRFFTNLGMSYLDLFLIHNFIGFIGLLAFAASVKQATFDKTKNIKLLGLIYILLPSVSFWSSSLGKDSIAFMAVGLALWSAINLKKRKIILIIAILSMFIVRPHIGVTLVIATILALIFDKNFNLYTRIALGTLTLISTAIILPIMLRYIGLGEVNDINDVEDYIDKRQSYNMEGGSSLDISSMSLPMQMFTYLFRPLPFEAHNLFSLLASLDNIILVFLFILGLIAYIKNNSPAIHSNRIFLWSFSILSLIMLATTTANLGIAMRQKWMFLPCLIFLLLTIIGKKNSSFEENKIINK